MSRYFLSHSSAHKPFCELLRTYLQSLGHDVWLDSFDLHHGTSIPQSIVDGIYDSDHFVLLMSPEIQNSIWVNWELNVATYRELTSRRVDFILPVMYQQVSVPRLICHKRHITSISTPQILGDELVGTNNSGGIISSSKGTHTISMKCILRGTTLNNLRRVTESLKNSCDTNGVYSFFPNYSANTPTVVKNGKTIISFEEKSTSVGVENRFTLIEAFANGEVKVSESILEPFGTATIFNVGRVISKITKFIKVMNHIYSSNGITNGSFDIEVSVAGLDNGFVFNGIPPQDCEPPMHFALGGEKSIPRGTNLSATISPQVSLALDVTTISNLVYEFQKDLFFPIQIKRFMANGELPLALNRDAVTRLVTLMLNSNLIE